MPCSVKFGTTGNFAGLLRISLFFSGRPGILNSVRFFDFSIPRHNSTGEKWMKPPAQGFKAAPVGLISNRLKERTPPLPEKINRGNGGDAGSSPAWMWQRGGDLAAGKSRSGGHRRGLRRKGRSPLLSISRPGSRPGASTKPTEGTGGSLLETWLGASTKAARESIFSYETNTHMKEKKTYTCTNFTGFYPVGVAAIVSGRNRVDAAKRLNSELSRLGLSGDAKPEDMQEYVGGTLILCDGNY